MLYLVSFPNMRPQAYCLLLPGNRRGLALRAADPAPGPRQSRPGAEAHHPGRAQPRGRAITSERSVITARATGSALLHLASSYHCSSTWTATNSPRQYAQVHYYRHREGIIGRDPSDSCTLGLPTLSADLLLHGLLYRGSQGNAIRDPILLSTPVYQCSRVNIWPIMKVCHNPIRYYTPAGACQAESLQDAQQFFAASWYNGTKSDCATMQGNSGWYYFRCKCKLGFLRSNQRQSL